MAHIMAAFSTQLVEMNPAPLRLAPFVFGAMVVLACGPVAAWAAEPAAATSAAKPAAGTAPKAPKPAAKAAPKLLTRAELRACMEQEGRLKGLREDYARRHEALEKAKADLQTETQALKQALETLDRTSEAAVNEYRNRVALHDNTVDDYNARVPEFNAAAGMLQGEESSYTQNCAGRSFEEGDELAIKRARKQ
jgi:hypothetical protein